MKLLDQIYFSFSVNSAVSEELSKKFGRLMLLSLLPVL